MFAGVVAMSGWVALAALPQEPSPTTSSTSSSEATVDEAKARAKALFDEGRAHYDLGRFAEALTAFEKAYEVMPLPAFLFNIGQCHFQEKRYARAVFFYERYLEVLPDASNRATIEDLIVEAKSLDAEATRASPPASAANAPGATGASADDDGIMWIAAAGAFAVAATIGVVTYVMWTSPPPPGSLGLVDRRTP
jgi:tetratricopeptide (TPR) repeat protein